MAAQIGCKSRRGAADVDDQVDQLGVGLEQEKSCTPAGSRQEGVEPRERLAGMGGGGEARQQFGLDPSKAARAFRAQRGIGPPTLDDRLGFERGPAALIRGGEEIRRQRLDRSSRRTSRADQAEASGSPIMWAMVTIPSDVAGTRWVWASLTIWMRCSISRCSR